MKEERETWVDMLENLPAELEQAPVPGTQALWKGLLVLKHISEAPAALRFSELCEKTDMSKGTLHRILQVLMSFQMVRLEPQAQTYSLGPKLFEMAHSVWQDFDLRSAAEPELLRMKTLSGETTRLGVLDGDNVLVIDQKDTDKPLRLAMGVGRRLDLHASAMGKAVLAYLPPSQQRSLLKHCNFKGHTHNTLQTEAECLHHLDLVKARGYAISVEEQFDGVCSVAAPILDQQLHAIGVISIVGASHGLPERKLHALGREVMQAGRRISGNAGVNFMSIATHKRPAYDQEPQWRCVSQAEAFLGEGAFWNAAQNTVEWVDVLAPALCSTDLCTGQTRIVNVDEIISAVVPKASGGHVAISQYGFRNLDRSTGYLRELASPSSMEGRRFNDGKCDAAGRFWAGTLALDAAPKQGQLYCLDVDGQLYKRLEGLHIANGIAWNAANNTLYLADAGAQCIYAFDYDLTTGAIANQRVFVDFSDTEGVPDGLAVDRQGGVWCALWDGWRVVRIAANGIVDRAIHLPVPRPTSCTFGGDKGSTLFVTSARIRLSESTLVEAPLSGAVFAIETSVKGVPCHAYGA